MSDCAKLGCMNTGNTQQVLNLRLMPANTFATFYSSSDQTLISVLKNVASGILLEPQIFLWGRAGTGKTHALQAMCHVATNSQKRAMYIPLGELVSKHPSSISELQAMDLICLDDAHAIAKNNLWEKALFNFINYQRAEKTTLIISSRYAPANNLFALSDLNSRTVWGPVYKLNTLTDDDLNLVLQLQAKVRGLELSDDVRRYLLTHHQRDVSILVAMLEKINRVSLRKQRKITVAFLKKEFSRL